MREKTVRYCVICGEPLTKNQSKYCSLECRTVAARERNKLRYHQKRQEGSLAFKAYLAKNSKRATERYLSRRREKSMDYAKQILKLDSIEDVAAFIDHNFIFRRNG